MWLWATTFHLPPSLVPHTDISAAIQSERSRLISNARRPRQRRREMGSKRDRTQSIKRRRVLLELRRCVPGTATLTWMITLQVIRDHSRLMSLSQTKGSGLTSRPHNLSFSKNRFYLEQSDSLGSIANASLLSSI